jgi:magnesium chelatase family protein
VLFLDEAPEFDRDVLDALRQPLEHGHVVLTRSRQTARFPADFTLVLAARPCPCTSLAGLACTCPPIIQRRYRARLAGLAGRVDLTARLHLPRQAADVPDPGELSTMVAARVADARQRAARRLAGTPWRLNARIPGAELRRRFPPTPGAQAVLDRAIELGEVSFFGAGRVLAVAWTLADLAGAGRPGGAEAVQALAFRLAPQA